MKKLLFVSLINLFFLFSIGKSQLIDNWELVNVTGGSTISILDTMFLLRHSKDTVSLSNNGGYNFTDILSFNSQTKDSTFLQIVKSKITDHKHIFVLVDSIKSLGYDNFGNSKYNYKASLFKSVDGGTTFKHIIINDKWRDRQSVILDMLNNDKGIVIQWKSSIEQGEISDQIYFTSDGWETWEKIKCPPNLKASKFAKYFDNNKIAIMTQGIEKLYITSDLGNNWQTYEVPTTEKKMMGKIYFVTPNTFFYILQERTDTQYVYNYKIFKTTDAGNSWNMINTPTDKCNSFSPTNSINSYYLSSEGLPYYTTNDGDSWRKFNYAYYDGYELGLMDIKQFSETLIYGIGTSLFKYTGKKTLKPPKFISPDSIAYINPYNVKLEWENILGANKYYLQIVKREGNPWSHLERPPANFDTVLFVDDSITGSTVYPLGNLEYNREYTCRIKAVNDSLSSPWLRFLFWTAEDETEIKEHILSKTGSLHLYPNPAKDEMIITIDEAVTNNADIKIYNSKGLMIKELNTKIENNLIKINVSDLPSGMYYLKIINGVNLMYEKFIVNR